jgi:ABC-type polysaccharide/polyol phosphate transport system ATPase subunit
MSMRECSAILRNVHLSIPILTPGQRRLLHGSLIKSAIGGTLNRQNGKVHVQALRGVSFELEHGDHLGVIGPNGAGKTTLLKVIAGIYPPSKGEVIVQGEVGCLFNIDAGITQEMTGYECIRFQHLIYGDPSEPWQRLAEDVAAFTELGDYLELPLRTYSAGMRARLMASLATSWRREVLLLDEGIGAGDQAFQKKFAKRIASLLESAGLLVVASHSAGLLRQYCSQGIVLVHGEVKKAGSIDEVLDFYSRMHLHGEVMKAGSIDEVHDLYSQMH